jgi:hypothetical protein
MRPMPISSNNAQVRPLQLCMPAVLRETGGDNTTRQSQSIGNAGGNSQIQNQPASIRNLWFAERQWLGTPLSAAELQWGVNQGLISSALLK